MFNVNAMLLGGVELSPSSKYKSFAPHLAQDSNTVREIFAGLERLEQQYTAAFAAHKASSRGYFTPDEDDSVRSMLLSYRNMRLATFAAVWRYAHYSLETDKATQLRGFVLGYATALAVFSKSLKFIQMCEPFELVRAKLNEPDERFNIETGYFDNIVQTYCSVNYLMLFAKGDKFWRQNRKLLERPEFANDPIIAEFAPKIKRLRAVCWKLFWPAMRGRIKHEKRHKLRMMFAPLRMTGWGAQTLLGHAVARMRTTLDYQPAIQGDGLDYLLERLRPGDFLFTRTEHKATTALLPGFFGHVAIYLGSIEQLEAMGLPDTPALRTVMAEMRSRPAKRGWVLEAKHPGVIVQTLEEALYCDHVLALRPTLAPQALASALNTMVGFIGVPYDFDFDFNRTSHVVCTELVYRALHNRDGYHFDLKKRMGRYTLSVDDIVRTYMGEHDSGRWAKIAFLSEGRESKAMPLDPEAIPQILRGLLP